MDEIQCIVAVVYIAHADFDSSASNNGMMVQSHDQQIVLNFRFFFSTILFMYASLNWAKSILYYHQSICSLWLIASMSDYTDIIVLVQ